MNLQQEFQIAVVRDVYLRILKECDYDARVFLKMVADYGAVGAVKSLLASATVQSGLRGLNRKGRLDLSIEHLAIQPRWEDLFSHREREAARERLERRARRSRFKKLGGEHACEAGSHCPLATPGTGP